MRDQDFSLTLTLDAAPEAVFDAIVDVHAWWSGHIEGRADAIGATFRYRYRDMHDSTQRVTELDRGRRVVWRVLDAHLAFVEAPREWVGSDIVFALSASGGGTTLTFTHVGLAPTCACYAACASGWDALLRGNLRRRVTTGAAQPDVFARGGPA
ncbi:MAG: SRPBCC domain-containing protein [Polyangiales bacterium]